MERVLQDWVTIQGNGTVTQLASAYLHVDGHENLIATVQIASQQSTISFYLQTAPDRLDAHFLTMNPPGLAVAAGTFTLPLLSAYANVPPSSYLRWQTYGTSSYSLTFRVMIAGLSAPQVARLGAR